MRLRQNFQNFAILAQISASDPGPIASRVLLIGYCETARIRGARGRERYESEERVAKGIRRKVEDAVKDEHRGWSEAIHFHPREWSMELSHESRDTETDESRKKLSSSSSRDSSNPSKGYKQHIESKQRIDCRHCQLK